MTNRNLSIGLIDEKECPIEAIAYAQSMGVPQVKAIQPKSPSQLDEAIEEAKDYDLLILDCKLYLNNSDWLCVSNEPPETVDGIRMTQAAASVYKALREMGKTVIGLSAESSEEECSSEMLSITKRLIESAN
jgi:hypothetical protein